MAVCAADSYMRASQREIRRIVIEGGRLPGFSRVTGCTVLTELLRLMIWIRRLFVLRLMTGPAV